ncbi:unnamed protein product [Adineta steineri]|uniref:Uncharacterized protein n=1 Tax=Adineta steineri TaxID=433720 RepID=A0A813QNM1_9BILA|nr:unnamed protein product [Adineta steineri]CAF3934048.1 unnamed protein product [Adineta steineri]
MVIEKLSFAEKKKKTIFSRFTDRFMNQQRSSKRDQSVQTSLHPASILINSHTKQQTCSSYTNTNNQTPSHRRRSSLKTFLTLQSPKPISLIHRTRRCSINLKTPKRLSSECLQVALIRKIQPVNHFESPLVLSSTASYYSHKHIYNDDETTSRDELLSIGPMKWSTPNRTIVYKTSSPNNNISDQQRRLYTVDQLSFSNIFDRSD